MKNPDDMRALRLELATATHFARRGYRLAWPEMVGGGTFDLLVADLGDGLEVECKSVSSDKGRKVHRREALDFNQLLVSELASIRKNLKIGLSVVLTVPGKLPTRHADRAALAKRVRQQINIGCGAQFEDGSDIRIGEFDATMIDPTDSKGIRATIERVTGTNNREAMLTGDGAGGALAFVVQSAQNDDMMDATFETLSDASRRQLTGTRPAMLIAGFDGIDGDQLRSVAEQDNDPQLPPTALAIKVSRFLSADHRDHVIGVGFVSSSALLPVANGVVDSGGTAYYFPKRESSFWREEFSGLFSWRASAA